MVRFLSVTMINAPLEKVWTFHLNPVGATKIMPAFPPMQLIRYDSPLQKDSTITFRIGVNWFYKNWILRVSEFEPMSFFTDEQVNGPFLLWRHRHEFKTIENNTEIKDELEIDYRMITFLKPLVNGLLRMILSQIFKMRYIKTSKILV